jgi:hypothetical protein
VTKPAPESQMLSSRVHYVTRGSRSVRPVLTNTVPLAFGVVGNMRSLAEHLDRMTGNPSVIR